MKKIYAIIFLFSFIILSSQDNRNHLRAPNSYIFDINLSKEIKGIKIPVKKAYDSWSNQEYLNQQIPAGAQSATLFWEDVPGLIRNVNMEGSGNDAKILVEVNRSKGEGNAVVAFKVDGVIYWSWHIWITDNPEQNALVYYNGLTPIDINGNPTFSGLKFMDRNLGATSANFLGAGWSKSAGLMYQFGRKDPFPRLYDKDMNYYELSGEVGNIRHLYFAQNAPYSSYIQPMWRNNAIEVNIRNSVKNPLTPILPQDPANITPWYSSSAFKTGTTTHDLWADNSKGANSYSKYMQLKSAYDPCPNGWRVPSFNHQQATQNWYSPWGKPNSQVNQTDIINPNVVNAGENQIKIYPNLGVDFRNSTNRVMGKFSLSGKYNFYNDKTLETSFYHQDIQTEVPLHSATMATAGESRILNIITDIARFDRNSGLGEYTVNSHGNGGKGGQGVRCVKDLNYQLTTILNAPVENYDFPTEYFSNPSLVEETDGLELPNSYVFMTNDASKLARKIPVKKAFAIYNQYLTDHDVLPNDLQAKYLWTTNKNLISKVKFIPDPTNIKNSYIAVFFKANETGNALISLQDTTGKNLWSWHIWSPNDDPRIDSKTYTYTTETERPMANTIGYTNSGGTILTTKFMDRNLGAIYAFPSEILDNETNAETIDKAKNSGGLQYQWGRKDPFPSFKYAGNSGNYSIFIPILDTNGLITGWEADVTESIYNSTYVVNNQGSTTHNTAGLSKSEKLMNMLKFAAENPMKVLSESTANDWISPISGLMPHRWGHAEDKSVFDPCPQGWRVPDMTFLNQVSTKNYETYTGQTTTMRGTSPWYFANNTVYLYNPNLVTSAASAAIKTEIENSFRGIPQNRGYNIASEYGGRKVMRNSTNVFGWKFTSTPTNYNIGNYPMTGIRNFTTTNTLLTNQNITGLWLGATGMFQYGYAHAMIISGDEMATSTTDQQNVRPKALLNVRCVKHMDIYRGGNGIPETDEAETYLKTFETANSNNSVEVYPNPSTGALYINNISHFSYDLFDLSGRLIKRGYFINGKANISEIEKGNYIIKIFDPKNKTYNVKKVMKR